MNQRRVVITGTGAVCAAGRDPQSILEAVRAGRSAIAPIRQWDTSQWPIQAAGEISDLNPRDMVDDRKLHKLIRRTDLFGLYAADRAIDASGLAAHRAALEPEAAVEYSDRTGVYVGSGGGSYESQYDYFPLLTAAEDELPAFGRELSSTVNPMWLLRTLPNNVLGHIGIRHGFKGANACITNHSIGGTLAVIEAMEALRTGEADRALAVGHDAPIEPQMVLYYHDVGLLAKDTIRPFDARRDGSLFGEGAAALALETEESARKRNAAILGEVLGGGSATDAQGLLAIRDDGDALARAIEAALEDASIHAAEVGMIAAHGNGTPQSDASEAAAIRRVFGKSAPPATAFKWAFGHLIAAAGIIEAALALASLSQRVVPGIATYAIADPDCAGVPVAAEPQSPRGDVALILCRGFAGTNAALLRRDLTHGMTEAPAAIPDAAARCGIDTVEIARIERLLSETTPEDLHRFFTAQELDDSGEGAGRAASLAARFAAKEACVKLFPREAALGQIEPGDFSVARDAYGAPQAILSPRAAAVLAKNRIRAIALSLTHDRLSASSVALALAEATEAPLSGRLIFRLLPFRRRVVLDNLRRVFGAGVPDAEIERLAQAHYAHLWRLFTEFLRFRSMSERQKAARVEVDNVAVFTRALERGRGILVLTGHFGNWEVATVAGLNKFPQMRGRIHFVRRPIKPRWLDRFVNWRFRRAGFGVLPKRGSLDAILDRLAAGDAIVFPFDQHAGPPDGIEIDFFGTPAWTFKSLALIALASDAAVIPAASWRKPDGRHVLRFEEPLSPISCAEVGEEIRRNTRAYNAALERLILRHPEQWYWVHRRWKRSAPRARVRHA